VKKEKTMSKAAKQPDKTTEKGDVFDCEVNTKDMQNNEPTETIATDTNETLADDSKATVKEHKKIDPLEEAQSEMKEQKDKYLRLMAEFDNYKRRTAREFQQVIESATERLMADIIHVREDFERAMKAKDKAVDLAVFVEGMQLVFNRLDETLKKHGLESFAVAGDVFDPQMHEAMMRMPHPTIAEDHVAEIFERGYKLKSKVIRHAKVIVSSGNAADTNVTETAT
jgi:molecular chaperone GrpE